MKAADVVAPTPSYIDLSQLPGGKDIFHGLPDQVRPIITEHALRVAEGAKKGDIPTLVYVLWDALRSVPYASANGSRTVGDVLQNPLYYLANVLRVLLEAGDLADTLTKQRDALDARICRLRGQRSVTAPEKGAA